MIDKDPRDLIERMCACLHGWSALWGPPANSPTRILVDEARRYLAQSEPKPPSLKEQAMEQLDCVEGVLRNQGVINTDKVRRALEALSDD
jgi:hypothetical protein